MAQVLNLCFVVWGLYFASVRTLAGNTLAAFLLALAVGCRPFSILILALFFLFIWLPLVKKAYNPLRWGVAFWLPFFVALGVGLCMAWYNFIRFGSIVEFGHNYLPEFMRAEYGQFHVAYFWSNLQNIVSPITFNAALGLEFSVFNGFFFLAANPIYIIWVLELMRRGYDKTITLQEGACLLLCCVSVVLLCLHKTLGGWQFGVRYMVDLIPYIWLCALQVLAEQSASDARNLAHATAKKSKGAAHTCPQKNPADWQWFVCALAIAFNVYGALYMLQA